MANNNNQAGLPNPLAIFAAPLTVLDAQAKALTEQLSNLLSVGNTGIQSMFGVLQAPFAAAPMEQVKAMLNMPMDMTKQVMTPFLANIPGAPAAGAGAGTPVTPPGQQAMPGFGQYTTPPAAQPEMTETVIKNVGGMFNIVKP